MKSQLFRMSLALEARGHTLVTDTRTMKYQVYARETTHNGRPTFYFLGVSGALRVGTASSKSMPCSETFKSLLLVEADAVLKANRQAKPSWWRQGR